MGGRRLVNRGRPLSLVNHPWRDDIAATVVRQQSLAMMSGAVRLAAVTTWIIGLMLTLGEFVATVEKGVPLMTAQDTSGRSVNIQRLADPVTDDDHVQGQPAAVVTLVQYGDYECPYTRLSRHSVHQLRREFTDNLRFVFRHFPLEEIHPHARAAATAAEAAGTQTDFWTMHEYLFEHQKALDDTDLTKYAIALGLDPGRFERDRRSPEVARRIERDLESGQRSGVEGTPTFYVNGIRHDGGYELERLRSAILASMQRKSEAH